MDLLGLGFKLLRRRADIGRLVELLEPVGDKLRPVLPEVMSLVKSLVQEIAPMTGQTAHELASFDVFWLQRSLNRIGSHVAVDGVNGPATEAAVRDFQTRSGLTSDGWAGPMTIAKIIDELARLN